MLAFRVKKPMQTVMLDKLGPKVDSAKWGIEGREIIQACHGMRERVKAGLEKISETSTVRPRTRLESARVQLRERRCGCIP